MPREREMSTASASSASSSSSAATTSARAVSYGISNSRYGRHRARSQLGHADGASSSTTPTGSSYNEASGSYMAMAAPSSTSASSPPPPPPPPPPPYSSAYEPVTASTKPTITRSTSGSSAVSSRAHRSPTTTSSKSANRRRQPSGSNGAANSTLNRREANGSLLSDDETSGSYVESPTTGPSGSSPLYPMATRGNSTRSSAALLSTASARFDTAPPMMERSCSASPASRHRHESSSSHSSLLSSMASVDGTPRRHARKLANDNDDQAGDETPRRRARKVMNGDDDDDDDDGISNDSDDRRNRTKRSGTAEGTNRGRPVRIKYESTTRGVGGGKREISHASLGKLIARLTDAHQYDAEFRDVFLLTYRCFCSPYDFIKKLMKRYTAVLTMCGGLDPDTLKETQKMLEQITQDEELETDRSSSSTSISTARSDINTGMEANVSIMRLLSVIKYWIKESGFIEMDLLSDRRAQRKLLALLQEIQSTTPVASIRQHAESLLMSVSQLIRQQNAPSSSPPSGSEMKSFMAIPGPPQLTHSTSQSSVSSDHESKDLTQSMLSSAMSKLKLTRSSSDSKKDRSAPGTKPKHSNSSSGADAFTPGSYDPANTFRRGSPRVTAPKMLRGITIGSMTDSMASSSSNPLEDVIQDTIQRARLTASRSSSRTSYDNVQPLSGVSAQDMADQLTLIEAECFFARINHRELTNKAWTRESKHKDAPHVMALIELFDGTAEWVSSEILHPQLQAAERARLIMLFIDAGDACYQLNNFNSLFEITTGLSAPCIRQLNTTWGLVSAASVEKYQVLMQVCSPEDNYRNYRQAFALAEGQPRLPCSFILVKDLFTIEEAMKSIEDGLVNWQKYRKVHKAISEALERQNLNYLPADGSSAAGISRKGKGALRHDRKVQLHIRHRLDTIRKDSTVLYQLARNANTQESIMFVNSLSEAGFL